MKAFFIKKELVMNYSMLIQIYKLPRREDPKGDQLKQYRRSTFTLQLSFAPLKKKLTKQQQKLYLYRLKSD